MAWRQADPSSRAGAVVPPPGGLHRLGRHAGVIEEHQQEALAAAGVGGVDGGCNFCRLVRWCALEVLRHEGEQVEVSQARPWLPDTSQA